MQYTVYRHDDTSAPTLNGAAGSLITVLDAILVNGYGTKSSQGWAKAFSATNRAAYRAASGQGNRRYLRVADDSPGAATSQEARITGYDTMSDVNTGTNPFPTAAQGLGGTVAAQCVRKSSAADSLKRSWVAFASPRAIAMFIQSELTPTYISDWFFGDFYSIKTVLSTTNTLLIGRTQENTNSGTVSRFDQLAAMNTTLTGHFAPGPYAGSTPSTAVGKGVSLIGVTGTHQYLTSVGAAGLISPNTPDNGLWIEKTWMHESANRIGRLTGIYGVAHANTVLCDGQLIYGSGDFMGKQFCAVTPTANTGLILVEISDTLENN